MNYDGFDRRRMISQRKRVIKKKRVINKKCEVVKVVGTVITFKLTNYT